MVQIDNKGLKDIALYAVLNKKLFQKLKAQN